MNGAARLVLHSIGGGTLISPGSKCAVMNGWPVKWKSGLQVHGLSQITLKQMVQLSHSIPLTINLNLTQ